MANTNIQKLVLKNAQAVLYIVGSALTVFNLFAFKLTNSGSLYFRDENQLWLSVGVAMVMAGIVIRNWNKL